MITERTLVGTRCVSPRETDGPASTIDSWSASKGTGALRIFVGVLLVCCFSSLAAAITLAPILSGLSQPVFAGHAGDGTNRLFIVERAGVIRVLQPGASTPTVFLDIQPRVLSAGQEHGLLGLAFHPNYETNGRFFVFYTGANGTLIVAEYHASPANSNVAGTAETVLLTIAHPFDNHNGGMLAFGPDGYLYIGVGDGGSANDPFNNGQNINSLLGKILRIDVNVPGVAYASPATNPYYGSQPGLDEIFAIGFRNPWRFSFDRASGQLWVADVGQGAREEVDTPIVSGGNYGWRVYEGFSCTGLDPGLCNPANYVFPLFDYAHAGGRCSITGGYVYRGSQGALPPGAYVYADFCTGEILQWDGSAQRLLLDTAMNISSFGEDEQGELYVVDLNGTVSKILPTAGASGIADIDASVSATRYDGLTDGLLIIRYLFGLRGPALIAGALGGTATRRDPADIAAYLDANRAAFDIDGNGQVDGLTDGLLLVRYLFGLRGATLVENAIGPGATRNTAPSVEAYLQTLMP